MSSSKHRLSAITAFSPNRGSVEARNVSNPYSLTVPGRHSKRALRPASIPLSIRPSSSQDQEKLFETPTMPKKAVTVAEKPIRPHPEIRQSRALAAYQKHHNIYSTEKQKSHVTCWKIDDRMLALSVTITLAFLIMIGVPLVAVIAQKYIVQLPVNVLVPSYKFPDAGAWNRLYDAYVFSMPL
jgi:hypothetical protein